MPNLVSLKKRLIEENFFRPRWYSIFLNPYFINRNSLYRAIRQFSQNVPGTASVLDVGCGLKPYRNLFETDYYTGIDIEGGGHENTSKRPDAYYDGLHIPFPEKSFNTIVCTQVLEHADSPEILVSECTRVIQEGGLALFSMPFIYPEHEVPYDFRRFTRFEHERLFKNNCFKEIRIEKTTGIFGTFGQLFVIWIFEGIPFRSTILKALLSIFIFAPIQILSLFLDWCTGKSGPTMDYIIFLKK